jgi:hypothetical protein
MGEFDRSVRKGLREQTALKREQELAGEQELIEDVRRWFRELPTGVKDQLASLAYHHGKVPNELGRLSHTHGTRADFSFARLLEAIESKEPSESKIVKTVLDSLSVLKKERLFELLKRGDKNLVRSTIHALAEDRYRFPPRP